MHKVSCQYCDMVMEQTSMCQCPTCITYMSSKKTQQQTRLFAPEDKNDSNDEDNVNNDNSDGVNMLNLPVVPAAPPFLM